MSAKKIVICMGSSCYARGNSRNVQLAENFLDEHGLSDQNCLDLDVSGGLCMGNCMDGPIVVIDDVVYKHVDKNLLLDLLNSNINLEPAR